MIFTHIHIFTNIIEVSRIKYRNKLFALNILYIFVHYVHPMHFRAFKLPINA